MLEIAPLLLAFALALPLAPNSAQVSSVCASETFAVAAGFDKIVSRQTPVAVAASNIGFGEKAAPVARGVLSGEQNSAISLLRSPLTESNRLNGDRRGLRGSAVGRSDLAALLASTIPNR